EDLVVLVAERGEDLLGGGGVLDGLGDPHGGTVMPPRPRVRPGSSSATTRAWDRRSCCCSRVVSPWGSGDTGCSRRAVATSWTNCCSAELAVTTAAATSADSGRWQSS